MIKTKIDVRRPNFWQEGIDAIEGDIKKLEGLVR